MNKKLTFWSIVLYTINSIIGIGIFLSPGGVVKMVGSIAPIIYILAAVFTIFLAVTFAVCAKYVVKGGASYAYSKAAFGDNVGFYVGITRVVASSIAWGVLASAVIKSIYRIFNINSSFTNVTIGFVILMFFLFLINVFGIHLFSIINNISTIGKLFALIITIVFGIIIVIKTGEIHIYDIDKIVIKNEFTGTSIATAVIAAFYAFAGFESVATGSMDMEKPEYNLPRAIPLAMVIIAIIYVSIITVTMMINPNAIATSKDPVVLAAVFSNKYLKGVIILGAIISMIGINVAASFATPRVFESMAKEGQVPKIFTKRTKTDIPIYSFILTALIAIVIPMSFNYNMGSIIIISSISRFVQFIVVPMGLITFYLGIQKEEVLKANKNFVTDIIFPIVALILTVILLYFFDWKGRFSILDNGVRHPNWYAIIAMIIGYIILPLILFIYKKVHLDGGK